MLLNSLVKGKAQRDQTFKIPTTKVFSSESNAKKFLELKSMSKFASVQAKISIYSSFIKLFKDHMALKN